MMENSLLILIIVLFGAMLVLNLYFRLKVMRSYRNMVRAGVQAKARDLLSSDALETIVIPAHKESEKEIRTFVKHLKNGFRMTSVLLGLVVLFGYILMRYKN